MGSYYATRPKQRSQEFEFLLKKICSQNQKFIFLFCDDARRYFWRGFAGFDGWGAGAINYKNMGFL